MKEILWVLELQQPVLARLGGELLRSGSSPSCLPEECFRFLGSVAQRLEQILKKSTSGLISTLLQC